MEVTRKRFGSAKLKLGIFNKTARTVCRIRPSWFCEIFTVNRSRRIQAVGEVTAAFWDVQPMLLAWDSFRKTKIFLFFSFLLLSLVHKFLSSFVREKGCHRLIQGCSKPQIKKILPGEVFRRCRTAAYKLQNSDSVDSAQI